ncbi:hypothetical protein F5148DRAFT_103337 [Russula earlei]|uniref:Uncharacterized protein n=1 Tax=Russula earlei TaxID=71964 RepID=A0ACC0U7Q1_9AGAM|nr:hypothetical protein F5148DRAFT_103337 [Russula earlei]
MLKRSLPHQQHPCATCGDESCTVGPSAHSVTPRGMIGTTNGLAQTVASVQRAIGPAIVASLFSLSLENNIMGGYGVFYGLTLCTFGVVFLASRLPPDRWRPERMWF